MEVTEVGQKRHLIIESQSLGKQLTIFKHLEASTVVLKGTQKEKKNRKKNQDLLFGVTCWSKKALFNWKEQYNYELSGTKIIWEVRLMREFIQVI